MTHLSDEAVAAFADNVLRGGARERAKRHCAECAECNHAVAVQREAVWALRAAPAPALPSDLLDRLRSVPSTTPIGAVPATVDDDGTVMFASFAAAALVPAARRERHVRPFVSTTAVMAVAAAVAAGSVAISRADDPPTRTAPGPSVTDRLPVQLAVHFDRAPHR